MSVLSDDQLIEIYALNCDCEGTRVMLNGLRAVAEAAVKADHQDRAAVNNSEMTWKMPDYKPAYDEWMDKTDWVQEELNKKLLPVKALGMHRADIIKEIVYSLRKENTLLRKTFELF